MTWLKYSLIEEGDRIELIYTADSYTNLKSGDKGTVKRVQYYGYETSNYPVTQIECLYINWDSGSTLSLIPEAGDKWKVIYD